jgi:hypothetical protein
MTKTRAVAMGLITVLAMAPAFARSNHDGNEGNEGNGGKGGQFSHSVTEIADPTIITASGKYAVTADISGLNADGCVITIAANNVELNLDGFVLDRGDGNGICADSVQKVAVRDGKIVSTSGVDTTSAIVFNNVTRFTIDSVVSYSAAAAGLGFSITDSTKGKVQYNKVLGSTTGVSVSGLDNVVTGNTISGGMLIQSDNTNVVDNTVLSNPVGLGVITVQGSFNKIMDNVASSLVMPDTDDHANAIRENTFVSSATGTAGLEIAGHDNIVRDNVIDSGSSFGLKFTGTSVDNTFRGNTAFNNAGVGCVNPSGNADFCDEGVGNLSNGGNYLPASM